MDEIMHSFLYLEPEGTLGRLFCPLEFCSLAGGQMKFKYRDGGPYITNYKGRRGEMGTTQEGGAGCAQLWLLLAFLFKHHQETHTSCLT